jgi:uncharacterized protein DUF6655
MRRFASILTVFAACAAASCSTARQSEPQLTATEEMLISAAADRAAGQLNLSIPRGRAVFVDGSYYKGLDAEYTVAAVREKLLLSGMRLTNDRGKAQTVVELRNGAQSTDEHSKLVGIPSFDIPIPLAGAFKFPEIAFYKKAQEVGVSKLAATAYDTKTGAFEAANGPFYGFAHQTEYTVFLFMSWGTTDALPDETPETGAGQ